MAYTSSPILQTYASKQIAAAYDLDLRPDSMLLNSLGLYQDAGMVNLLPMKHKNYITKEDEIHAITRQPIHGTRVASGINRGCYVWEKTAGTVYYFCVVGTGIYTSTNFTTWTQVNTLLTSATTPVRFTEFINDVNVKTLVLVDGIEGYVFSDNTAGTKITDVDFPTPHVPFPVYLDGYLFLAKAGTGDIYNSDLLDPTAWTPGNFISSELYPDDVQALVKINNYLMAIGQQGTEFFYDAGNAPGTPLARSDGVSLPFGTQLPNSIASNKDTVIFIANNNDGESSIKMVQDFKADNINPSFLISSLNARMNAPTSPTNAAAVRGFFFRQAGLAHYGIAFQGDTASPNLSNATFVYSFDTGWWSEFRIGDAFVASAPFPVYFTAPLSVTGELVTYVSGHIGSNAFFGKMEERTDGTLFLRTAVDHLLGINNITISTELRTPCLDFDTFNLKTMSRLGVYVTENTSSGASSGAPVTLNVSWTDDDFKTFNTPVPLIFGAGLNFPFITQLGIFRQRAFKIAYSNDYFLRYKGIQVDINKGQQ